MSEVPLYPSTRNRNSGAEREFFIDNLLVRIHFIIVMIRWTGLAPWKFEFPFPGSLTSTFLFQVHMDDIPASPDLRPCRSSRVTHQFKNNQSTEMCSGSEAGSYLRLIDLCITQLKVQGPSRTCNESKEEEKRRSPPPEPPAPPLLRGNLLLYYAPA